MFRTCPICNTVLIGKEIDRKRIISELPKGLKNIPNKKEKIMRYECLECKRKVIERLTNSTYYFLFVGNKIFTYYCGWKLFSDRIKVVYT